jgi:hypothetical protein
MSRWRQDNVVEELDDEEIARILQEEEYEIARQQQREAQQRQQQQAKAQATAAPRRGSGPVAPASNDEVLLLQSRCSAVSGTTVLKGSLYLYRNMLKFVCVERGKEVDVSIHIATIELVNPACSIKSKDSLAPPRIVNTRGAEQNVLQIYTQDKRIHTFFNFADAKAFQQVFNILSSIHKNNTAAAPPSYSAVAVAATSPSPPVTMPAAGSPMFAPGPMGVPAMMAPPGAMMYPGMYPQGAYPGAFPPQPQYYVMPPHGFPAQPPPQTQQAQAADSTAQAADFHQLHQQMLRLQIQQQYPMQQQDSSGQPPQPQPFMPAPYYYPYPPAPATLHPAPTASGDASAPSGEQQQQQQAPFAAMPPPYYYPPPMPYAMPGAEMQQPFAPYPYAYAAPPTQTQQLPPQTQQQQQQAQPRPSGPPEDLLA